MSGEGGVICLLSELRFHELTTRAPFEVWMALEEAGGAPDNARPDNARRRRACYAVARPGHDVPGRAAKRKVAAKRSPAITSARPCPRARAVAQPPLQRAGADVGPERVAGVGDARVGRDHIGPAGRADHQYLHRHAQRECRKQSSLAYSRYGRACCSRGRFLTVRLAFEAADVAAREVDRPARLAAAPLAVPAREMGRGECPRNQRERSCDFLEYAHVRVCGIVLIAVRSLA